MKVETVDYLAIPTRDLAGAVTWFSGETVDSGVCRTAFFTDPDGNPITLHRRYAPRD
jgi:hypothetical protein